MPYLEISAPLTLMRLFGRLFMDIMSTMDFVENMYNVQCEVRRYALVLVLVLVGVL